MKKILLSVIMVSLIPAGIMMFPSCTRHECTVEEISIIPQPLLTEAGTGYCRLTSNTRVLVGGEDPQVYETAGYLAGRMGWKAERRIQNSERRREGKGEDHLIRNAVQLLLDEESQPLGKEGYDLLVNRKGILIRAYQPEGLFYGVQTLLQLMPAEVFGDPVAGREWMIPAVHVTDSPRFTWRGMHLDVSRHFFPVEFVKRYIDLIAMHKMNVFHWHLTDDNGWRIEIKKYPLLTDVAAWRVDREDQPWNERTPPEEGEQAMYGGYYTQDQIREIVEYARQRFIMVVPEIEMPGHASEVFAAYPQFSCRGEKLFVRPGSYWPNNDIFCAGNDSVYTFLEDILTEVMDMFPSAYIHIGGDEADKTQWKDCPKCQRRIREESLSDEKELQSYFVKRIEKFLNASGRKLIGWDEILEGGLAPEATVMSWRGFEGGIEAASQGHDVIMCPVSHCYFDYYQADPDFQPLAIGGFTPLKKVYSFESTPPELADEQVKHILGGQGNVWTEYISTPGHAEYMSVPRMTALAEVLWSAGNLRNWDGFRERLQHQFLRFDEMGVNYSVGSFAVGYQTFRDSLSGQVWVELTSEQYQPEIRYTLDGSIPSKQSFLYTSPLLLDSARFVKAAIFYGDSMMERPAEKGIILHKATGKPVSYRFNWSNRYPGRQSLTLVDGLRGSGRHNDGYWQGFHGNDLEVLIDLQKEDSIQQVIAGFLDRPGSWIFPPVRMEVSVSADSITWTGFVKDLDLVHNEKEYSVRESEFSFDKMPARYVKIHAFNVGICPPWHPGSGEKAWLFTDEIIVK